MRRFLSFLSILILALVTLLTSCTSKTGDDKQTDDNNYISIITGGTSEYKIVRPDTCGEKVINAMQTVSRGISEALGVTLEVTTDWEKAGSDPAARPEYEILIGDTNRDESVGVEAELGEDDWVIKMVGKKVVIKGGSDSATLAAAEYFIDTYVKANATSGELKLAADMFYTHVDGPVILSMLPGNLYYYEDVYTPKLTASFSCTAGFDKEKSALLVGGSDVSANAKWTDTTVEYTSPALAAGTYSYELKIADGNGLVTSKTQSFSLGDGSVMNLYRGEVHSHTEESDGQGTVVEAYEYAKNSGADFFAVTDHSNYLTLESYMAQIKKAESFNEPGKFAALYGFEDTWNSSCGYWGHLNVINSLSLYTRKTETLTGFYKKVVKDADAVGMFNHPSYKWGNFAEYDFYSSGVDKVMNLMELKDSSYENEYTLALNRGWHISPIFNEDNHSKKWTTANESIGVALAPSLTRENIIEAFRANRTYTTSDKTLEIYYKANGEWMGSRLDNPSEINFNISLKTQKASGLGIVYLIAEDGVIVANTNLGNQKEYTWNLTLSAEYDYYYVKVQSTDIWAITSPVWVENRDKLIITKELDMSLVTDRNDGRDNAVTVNFKNSGSVKLTNVKVEYYLSAFDGFSISAQKPVLTVNCADLEPGAAADVTGLIDYTENSANRRITVVVTGNAGADRYTATSYTMLTPLMITELMPFTSSASGVKSAYEYIEIYNNTNSEINLNGYMLKLYEASGRTAAEVADATWNLNGFKVKAKGTLVLWIKPSGGSNKLTVKDFNAYYKTSLVEGRDIVVIEKQLLPDSGSIQLELANSYSDLSRVQYNWGDRYNKDVSMNNALTYTYSSEATVTADLTGTGVAATPGSLTNSKVPSVVSSNMLKNVA